MFEMRKLWILLVAITRECHWMLRRQIRTNHVGERFRIVSWHPYRFPCISLMLFVTSFFGLFVAPLLRLCESNKDVYFALRVAPILIKGCPKKIVRKSRCGRTSAAAFSLGNTHVSVPNPADDVNRTTMEALLGCT